MIMQIPLHNVASYRSTDQMVKLTHSWVRQYWMSQRLVIRMHQGVYEFYKPEGLRLGFTLFTTFHDPHNYVHGTGSRLFRACNYALGRPASTLAVGCIGKGRFTGPQG